MKNTIILLTSIILFMNCKTEHPPGTFGHDLNRLKKIDGIEVLKEGNAMIAVSGPYQNRIFTSTANGMDGKSYGWVNWELIEKNQHDTSIAYLGGENRIWFAPEWGPHSLFFKAGTAQKNENMGAPHDTNHEKFKEIKRAKKSITYGGEMQLKNYLDYVFYIYVERGVQIFSKKEIENDLKINIPENIAHVGFSAKTKIKNIGQKQFKKETGLIALWELGCMLTSPDTRVIIPLSQPTDSIVEYFAPLKNRMKFKGNILFYKADAMALHKIGVPPQYCKNIMGSYSPSQQLLNIVTFNFDNDSLYVNSVPKNTTPYKGDVVNIFNGEINKANNWNFPFYEFESSSSAKELKPSEVLFHQQTTYHFDGAEKELDEIARQLLGVGLKDIPVF